MKRKISIAVLLSLVAALALVALAGCSDAGKQAAIDAYKEAAAATSAAKNVKYDIDFDCTASVAGISPDSPPFDDALGAPRKPSRVAPGPLNAPTKLTVISVR